MKKRRVLKKEVFNFIGVINEETGKYESAHVWNTKKDNIHLR